MKFVSTSGNTPPTSFRTAVLAGLAPDGGLYIPEAIPVLPRHFVDAMQSQSLHAIGLEVISAFIDDIPRAALDGLIRRAWTFEIPLVHLYDNIFLLELFHGPTLAFKDVGARFLARTLSYYLQASGEDITIAVATSGDTGSAVAHGFFGVPHVSVYVLYPSGMISPLQEQQMTTLGGNIHALEVEGTFDDCQLLVKRALADHEVVSALRLTTANSISLGRLLPQITYYLWGVAQWQRVIGEGTIDQAPVFIVPSGNFGNITAGVYADAMGCPIASLIAATNMNDVGMRYIRTGVYSPRDAVRTYANAMDVGNPSNLSRLRTHFGDDVRCLQRRVSAASVTDAMVLEEIRATYEKCGRIVDPHTAIGVAAARMLSGTESRIVMATAHPAKFPDVITKALGVSLPLPEELRAAEGRTKQSVRVPADFGGFREILLRGS
jgi:threonine synthase